MRMTPSEKIPVAPRVATAEEEARLAAVPWILRRNALDIVRNEAAEQEQFALRIRDDVTRLTGVVTEIRTIQKQLKLHADLLAKQKDAKGFIKKGKALTTKLEELEAKLHNPKAKVAYDILAQKGGAKLYSQFGGLLSFATEGEGPPTQGMKQVADELEKDLAAREAEYAAVKSEEIAKLNELARKLNVPMIWIPAPAR